MVRGYGWGFWVKIEVEDRGWGGDGTGGGTGCRGCGYPAQPNNVVSSDSYHKPVRGKDRVRVSAMDKGLGQGTTSGRRG